MTDSFLINFNIVKISHYDRFNADGSITIINVSKECDRQGNIVKIEEREGLTLRYV